MVELSIGCSPSYTTAGAVTVQIRTQQQPSVFTGQTQVLSMATDPPVTQIQRTLGASQTMSPSQVQVPLGVMKPMSTPVPRDVVFGAVRSAITPAQVQVPLGAPMSTSTQAQTLVPLGATKSTTISVIDYQTVSGLTDVLNTIIGTQQLLLTHCQQQKPW